MRRSQPNAFRFLIPAVAFLWAACGDDGPPPPALVQAASSVSQDGTVGEAVTASPAVIVRDRSGNVLPGVRVSFSITAGGGSIAAATATSDMTGRASAGTWTLGTAPGENAVDAAVGSLERVRFTAQAAPGPAAAMTIVQGDDQLGLVGNPAPVPPTVRAEDGFGNPAEGTIVRFEVSVGDGGVSGGARAVGPDGTAAPLEWRLGATAGVNALTATVAGLPTLTFDATGERGPAARWSALDGDGQTAEAGTDVPVRPRVFVSDALENGVEGATVVFAIESGGGSITGDTVVTGADGTATVGSWTLGEIAGSQVLAAAVDSLPGDTVRFTVLATGPAGAYDIEIRFLTGVTASQEQAFAAARGKWRSAIIGDVPAATVNGSCAGNPINEVVDDLLILAQVVDIDGPGGILGQAGPCFIRSGSSLPVVGIMSFDAADLANLEASGLLDEVIVHEMGHVLGIGTIWNNLGLLEGAGTDDPFFTGAAALQAFEVVGGASYTGNPVPVANTGGAGTRDAHWRESVFATELMTGFINLGVANPLSIVSIASLEDLGYVVDLGAADAYTLPPPGFAAAQADATARIQLHEAPLPPPEVVDPDGA